jgi:hypothetical protein
MKHLKMIAAVMVVAGATQVSYAVQKHDPQFSKPLVFDWSAWQKSPDLLAQVREQNGSPKRKPDLYVLRGVSAAPNRDLVQEMRAQTGSPKSKQDVCVLRPASK